MIKQIRALLRFLAHWSRQGRPSLIWLIYTSRRMDEAFIREHSRELADVSQDDQFQYVTVAGKVFVWPRQSPIRALDQFLSELLQKQHPHHYDTSSTPLQAGDTVIDIGACEGGFSAFAAEKGAKVVAIEPSHLMSQVTRRLFTLRGLESPQIVNCLLGENPGEVPFVDDRNNPGSSRSADEFHQESYPIPVMTLDDFSHRHLPTGATFIKCDAEGWDAPILRSGKRFLTRYHPKIAVTTYHNPDDYREISIFLTSLGYKCEGKGLLYFPHSAEYRTLMLHASVPGKSG